MLKLPPPPPSDISPFVLRTISKGWFIKKRYEVWFYNNLVFVDNKIQVVKDIIHASNYAYNMGRMSHYVETHFPSDDLASKG